MATWLMKTEPESFSIDDLKARTTEPWTGVRNFVARNHMRRMAIGDRVLFYHSNAEPPGVAGLARVCKPSSTDETQFDPESQYYDPTSKREAPRWDCVDVEYVAHFAHYVPLERLRHEPGLEDMLVLQKGMRLSVQPVSEEHGDHVVEMGKTGWTAPAKVKKVVAAVAAVAAKLKEEKKVKKVVKIVKVAKVVKLVKKTAKKK